MSYTNQNNIYGTRYVQEKSSCEPIGVNYKKIHPIQTAEECIKPTECDYSSVTEDVGYINYEQGYSCNRNVQNKCSRNNCSQQCNQNLCSCGCGCGCNYDGANDCGFTCNPMENCGNLNNVIGDLTKAKPLCTYIDVVYDEKVAQGPTVFLTVSATTPRYTITSEFTQLGMCCNTCAIDASSVFTVENVKTTIKSFNLQGTPSLPATSVFIGGINPMSSTSNNTGFQLLVDPLVQNDVCACNKLATKSNVIISNIANWSFLAKYELCGKVTTNGSTCKFKITVDTPVTNATTISDSLTFIAPEVYIPNSDPQDATFVNVNFNGMGQLINPVITATGGPLPTNPVTLTIGGNLMLTCQSDVVVTKNQKVCLNGSMEK